MVVVEIEAAILRGRKAGHAFFGQHIDVFAGLRRAAEGACANRIKRLGHGPQPCFQLGLAGEEDAVGMPCAQVRFDGSDMVGCFAGVFLDVSRRALRAFFFAHPGDKSDRPFGVYPKFRKQMDGLHRNHHACAVVDGSRAQIPGIQVA